MRRACAICRKRRAHFRVRSGRFRADRQHDLCPKCTRATLNRMYATLWRRLMGS